MQRSSNSVGIVSVQGRAGDREYPCRVCLYVCMLPYIHTATAKRHYRCWLWRAKKGDGARPGKRRMTTFFYAGIFYFAAFFVLGFCLLLMFLVPVFCFSSCTYATSHRQTPLRNQLVGRCESKPEPNGAGYLCNESRSSRRSRSISRWGCCGLIPACMHA
ncbi:hypothetical protein F5Y05DRAFT_327527 [Hypoxylon sp. FL0543]|nr:hypothetical protein F5Y05DRAFT_327527 [Hypoxylon sp. FL0543]